MLKLLSGIYYVIVLFNLFISGLLWRQVRHRLFYDLFILWLFILVAVVVQGSLLSTITALPSTIAFTMTGLLIFIAYGRVLMNIVGRRIDWKIFALVYLFSYIPYGLLRIFTDRYEIFSFPVFFASILPVLYSSLTVFLDKKRAYTFCETALAVVLLLLGVHALDFTFVIHVEWFTPYGFAVGSVLTIFVSILSLASMMEVVTKENTKIRTQLDLQSVLCNSARMSTLGSMAFGMAHEINNPLTIVQFNTEYIQSEVDKCESCRFSDKLSTKFQEIYVSVMRIKNILHLLSNFTNEYAGRPKRRVNIDALVKDTITLCQAQFDSKEVLLEVENRLPEGTFVSGHGSNISQALMALLLNAYEALTSADLPKKVIFVELFADEDEVVIAVSDTGEGIDPKIRRKLFEPFVTTKIASKHPGLSLSISRRAIGEQGGALEIDEAAKLTRFCIRLPKAD